MDQKVNVNVIEADIQKLTLEKGDALIVKVKSDVVTPESMDALSQELRGRFPNNQILVFALPVGEDIELTKLQMPEYTASDCSAPTSYCSSCNCGKKERIEGKKP